MVIKDRAVATWSFFWFSLLTTSKNCEIWLPFGSAFCGEKPAKNVQMSKYSSLLISLFTLEGSLKPLYLKSAGKVAYPCTGRGSKSGPLLLFLPGKFCPGHWQSDAATNNLWMWHILDQKSEVISFHFIAYGNTLGMFRSEFRIDTFHRTIVIMFEGISRVI